MKSKNKLLILVMILLLISLVSASFVEAASIRDTFRSITSISGKINIYLIINAILILLVLLTALSFFTKDMKQKGIVQIAIVVLTILIVLEMKDGPLGSMYLWQIPKIAAFMHYKVIVNTIVIAAFLFFLVSIIFPESKINTKQIKVAIWILIILLSTSMATSLMKGQPYDKDTYPFVWQTEGVKHYLDYLWNPDTGILRGHHLLVFILSSLMFMWIFTSLLDVSKNPKLNTLIAWLLGAGVAHHTLVDVNKLFYVFSSIAVFIFYKNLSKEGAKPLSKIFSFILAFALVTSITYIAFGKTPFGFVYGEKPLMEAGGYVTGKPPGPPETPVKTVIKWGLFVGGGLVLVLFIIGARVMWKNELGKQYLKRLLKYDIWWRFWNYIYRKIRWGKFKGIFRIFNLLKYLGDWKTRVIEGEEPDVFRDLRYQLHMMMDYNERYAVYSEKRTAVVMRLKASEELKKALRGDAYLDKDIVFFEMRVYKDGSRFRYNRETKEYEYISDKPVKTEYISPTGESSPFDSVWGWNYGSSRVFEIEKEIYDNIDFFKIENILKPETNKDTITKKLTRIRNTMKNVTEAYKKMQGYYELYKEDIERAGIHNIFESYRFEVVDMWNPARGHTWLFADPNATIKATLKVRGLTGKKVKTDEGNRYIQVNSLGWINTPVTKNYKKHDYGSLRISVKDIIHPSFLQVCEWIHRSWDSYMEDMRQGQYHSHTRTALDYIESHRKRRMSLYPGDDAKIQHITGPTGKENPAYDRVALRNPSKVTFIGTDNYDDAVEAIRKYDNYFPAVSGLGFALYLPYEIEQDLRPIQFARREMRRYQWDTGFEFVFEKDAATIKNERRDLLFTRKPREFGGTKK